MSKSLAAAALLIAVLGGPGAYARTWTDTTGKFSVEAEFVDVSEGKVRLKGADGKTIHIPLERLSAGDREFVKAHAGQNPFEDSTDDTPNKGAAVESGSSESTAAPKPAAKARRSVAFYLGNNLASTVINRTGNPRAIQLVQMDATLKLMDQQANALGIQLPPSVSNKNARLDDFGKKTKIAMAKELSDRHGTRIASAFTLGAVVPLCALDKLTEANHRVILQQVATAGKTAGLDAKELSEFTGKLRRLPSNADRLAAIQEFNKQTAARFDAEDGVQQPQNEGILAQAPGAVPRPAGQGLPLFAGPPAPRPAAIPQPTGISPCKYSVNYKFGQYNIKQGAHIDLDFPQAKHHYAFDLTRDISSLPIDTQYAQFDKQFHFAADEAHGVKTALAAVKSQLIYNGRVLIIPRD